MARFLYYQLFVLLAMDEISLDKLTYDKLTLDDVAFVLYNGTELDKVELDKVSLYEVTFLKVTLTILKSVSIFNPIAAKTINKTMKKPRAKKATKALKIFKFSLDLGFGQPVIALGIFPYFMK